MEQKVLDLLQEIFDKYGGAELYEQNNKTRFTGLVADYFYEQEGIKRVLQNAINNGFPFRLLELRNLESERRKPQFQAITKQYIAENFLDQRVNMLIEYFFTMLFPEPSVSTIATEEDGKWTDEYGVVYSADKTKLIYGFNIKEHIRKLNFSEMVSYYEVLSSCKIICDKAFSLYEETIEDMGLEVTIRHLSYSKLRSIVLPKSVTHIGDDNFNECYKLTEIIADSNYFKSIDGVLYTSDFKTLICYPRGKKDKYYQIHKETIKIEKDALKGCANLQSVELPTSMAHIEDGTFDYCSELTEIIVDSNYFKSIDGVLYTSDFKTLVCYPKGKKDKYYEIHKGTTKIEKGAFSKCKKIQVIDLPNTLTYIGDKAFSGCSKLTKLIANSNYFKSKDGVLYTSGFKTLIRYPQGKTDKNCQIHKDTINIEKHAFEGCTKLENITFSDSLRNIGKSAFMDCFKLQGIELPNSLTYIEERSFWSCKNLKNIIFPDKLVYIGDYAFYHCNGLEYIKFPDSLKYIKKKAFLFCQNIHSIKLSDSIKYIGKRAFDGCFNLFSIEFSIVSPIHCTTSKLL